MHTPRRAVIGPIPKHRAMEPGLPIPLARARTVAEIEAVARKRRARLLLKHPKPETKT